MNTDRLKGKLKEAVEDAIYVDELHATEVKKCFDAVVSNIQKDIAIVKRRASYIG